MKQTAQKAQHTPGPWKESFGGVMTVAKPYQQIAKCGDPLNARRIVACVNACEGISTDALDLNPYGVKDAVVEMANALAERDDLRAENQRLREALEAINARVSGEFDNPALIAMGNISTDPSCDVRWIARAALGDK